MKNKKEVFLLFNFSQEPGEDSDQPQGTYKVIYFFDQNGEVNYADFHKLSSSLNKDFDHLTFQTKEQLTEFSTQFIEANNYESISLLSANDFNIGIESCHDLSVFREIFKRYGFNIENKQDSSKSFFGKIF